jgi:hypothetical protein
MPAGAPFGLFVCLAVAGKLVGKMVLVGRLTEAEDQRVRTVTPAGGVGLKVQITRYSLPELHRYHEVEDLWDCWGHGCPGRECWSFAKNAF